MQECCIFLNAFPSPSALTPPGPKFWVGVGADSISAREFGDAAEIARGVGAWRRTTSAAIQQSWPARAVQCPTGALIATRPRNAAPYVQPYVGCRGEHCSPVSVCLVRKLPRKTRCCARLAGEHCSPLHSLHNKIGVFDALGATDVRPAPLAVITNARANRRGRRPRRPVQFCVIAKLMVYRAGKQCHPCTEAIIFEPTDYSTPSAAKHERMVNNL